MIESSAKARDIALDEGAEAACEDAAGELLSDLPLGVAVAGLREISQFSKSGDKGALANNVGRQMAAKGLGKLASAGAAAGATTLASSVAYAGVSGTITQGLVFVGLASPPAIVVVGPVVAGLGAGLLVGFGVRKVWRRARPRRRRAQE